MSPHLLAILLISFITIYMIYVVYKQHQQFHQNAVVPLPQPQISTIENQNLAVHFNNWIQESQSLEPSKKMLSVNIPTLLVFVFTIPPNVLYSLLYFSGSCEEVDIFIRPIIACGGMMITSFVVYLSVAKIKLQKMANQ